MKGERRKYQTAVIDGHTVKIRSGQTILDAAFKADIYIPTLCHLEHLEPYGGCRLCVVEIEDMKGFPTACTTPIVQGMKIRTVTPELQKLRREILEFTLSEHPFTCLVCNDRKECTDFMHTTRKVTTITGCNFCTSNGDCELQDLVDYLQLEEVKFPISYRGIQPVKDNPFYDLDYNLCILCGRCVRICNEERNSHVLSFVQRGNTTIVGTAFSESQVEAGCEFCGACVDVCPTGSISEKIGKWRGIPDKSVKTTCSLCPVACDMNVNTRNGDFIQIGPRPGNRSGPSQLCLRGKFLPAEIIDHPSRITTPLVKRENKWVEVSWNEALNFIARKLKGHKGDNFGLIASGQDTLEDIYTLQKFTRKVMGSNNVDIHGSYPWRGTPEQLHQFRRFRGTAGPADLEKAGVILLLGLDASVSHPLLENRIRKAYRSGKKLICFGSNPSRTSTFVTAELRYQAGEEESMVFLLLSTFGGINYRKEDIRVAEELSGIRAADLEQANSLLKGSEEVVIITGDDLLRNPRGENILQALFSLQAALNKEHLCKIMFPGYEGNLYSGALAGAHPDYLPGFKSVNSLSPGWTCNEMIRNTGENGITAMMVVGDLPGTSGLDRLNCLVQCNMFLTQVSEFADVLLPIPDFLENEGHLLSMEDRLKKVNKAVNKPAMVKSIPWIVAGLAKIMEEPGFSQKPAEIFRELRPFIEMPVQEDRKPTSMKYKPLHLVIGHEEQEKDNNYPVSMMLRYDHFRFRGNRLCGLSTDLESINGEGGIGLPDSLMVKLKLKQGDRVRIVSEQGEMNSVVSTVAGINCHTAWLNSNGFDTSGLMNGIYPESLVVKVKIEKI